MFQLFAAEPKGEFRESVRASSADLYLNCTGYNIRKDKNKRVAIYFAI